MFVSISEKFVSSVSPSYNYDLVVKELKMVYCHPRCNDECKYIAEFKNGLFLRRPILISQIYKYCKECDGSDLCKTPLCNTIAKIKKYNGYCLNCFIHLFPDEPNSRNYKTKEKDVVDNVLKLFPNLTWITDKKVQDGCSRRRPDLLVDMGTHIIIVEIDENSHKSYDCICENKRIMELSQDLNHRPIIFIRFNPDEYINQEGKVIKSCWKLNKMGIIQIMRSKQKEWNNRLQVLLDQIQYWVDNKTEKTIEIIELFY